jgi:hypothetical protein
VDPNPRCVRCDGDAKDRPLIGLTILWGLQKSGDKWSGGKIRDPDNGKIYKCSIALEGNKLKVRGFIGFSLLGRTQYGLPADWLAPQTSHSPQEKMLWLRPLHSKRSLTTFTAFLIHSETSSKSNT